MNIKVMFEQNPDLKKEVQAKIAQMNSLPKRHKTILGLLLRYYTDFLKVQVRIQRGNESLWLYKKLFDLRYSVLAIQQLTESLKVKNLFEIDLKIDGFEDSYLELLRRHHEKLFRLFRLM